MESKAEVQEIRVTFGMPEWWPPRRKDYYPYKDEKYWPRHTWAGQLDWDRIHIQKNSAEDAVFNLNGCCAVCSHPMNPHVEFQMPIGTRDPVKWVASTIAKLDRLIHRYKESRGD